MKNEEQLREEFFEKFDGDIIEDIGYNSPLIERKKEVEKLLVRKRGYEETLM